MPWKTVYVPPEIVLDFKGVRVFRTYKDGNFNEPSRYWYTTSESEDDEAFDIRDIYMSLRVTYPYLPAGDPAEDGVLHTTLLLAIELGFIPKKLEPGGNTSTT